MCLTEWFRNLDNQTPFNKFQFLRIILSVFKLVRSRYPAQDLNPRSRAMLDDRKQRESDSDRDSQIPSWLSALAIKVKANSIHFETKDGISRYSP